MRHHRNAGSTLACANALSMSPTPRPACPRTGPTGGAHDAVGEGVAAAVHVVKLGLGDRVVHVDGLHGMIRWREGEWAGNQGAAGSWPVTGSVQGSSSGGRGVGQAAQQGVHQGPASVAHKGEQGARGSNLVTRTLTQQKGAAALTGNSRVPAAVISYRRLTPVVVSSDTPTSLAAILRHLGRWERGWRLVGVSGGHYSVPARGCDLHTAPSLLKTPAQLTTTHG